MKKLVMALVGAMLFCAPANAAAIFTGTYSYDDLSLYGGYFDCCDQFQSVAITTLPPLQLGNYSIIVSSTNPNGTYVDVGSSVYLNGVMLYDDGSFMGDFHFFTPYASVTKYTFLSPNLYRVDFNVSDPAVSVTEYYPDGHVEQTADDEYPSPVVVEVYPPCAPFDSGCTALSTDIPGTFTITVFEAVPEPAEWAVLFAGFAAAGLWLRRSTATAARNQFAV